MLFYCTIAAMLVAGTAAADEYTYTAQLSGGNEIPPVMTEMRNHTVCFGISRIASTLREHS